MAYRARHAANLAVTGTQQARRQCVARVVRPAALDGQGGVPAPANGGGARDMLLGLDRWGFRDASTLLVRHRSRCDARRVTDRPGG